MRSLKTKKSHILVTAVNAVLLTAVLILNIAGNSLARSQKYNYASELWGNGSSDRYTQISCYFSENAEFSTDSLSQIRGNFTQEFKNISITSETKLFPDAYSKSAGNVTVTGDLSGRSEAELTVAGGDFFFFRNFTLLDGAYFTDEDTMQDGAVIDKNLAWSLYGSFRISGMNLYINGVKFYISGVIDTPQTSAETECAGSMPKINIPYDNANLALSGSTEKFSRISCYECVLPDPVKNFAYNMVKKQFSETYRNKISTVNNSTRFSPQKRIKAFRNISDYAVQKDGIIFPYWENASRKTEFKLSFIYFFRNILLVFPCLTLAYILILCIKKLKVLKKIYTAKAVSLFEKIRWDIICRTEKRSKNKADK